MGDRASGESQAGGALYPEGVIVREALGWKEKSGTQCVGHSRSMRAAGTVVWDNFYTYFPCGLTPCDQEAWGHQNFRLTGEGLWLQAALQGSVVPGIRSLPILAGTRA